jgi:tetratricopeptide (TPR) repeat protein
MKFLDRAAVRPRLEPASRLRLAELYAEQGQPRRAIELVAPLGEAAGPRVARWHRALGENDAAAAIYARMIEGPADAPAERGFDAQTALDAATFFAARGQPEQAEKCLARLDVLHLQPGAKELVRAKYAERQGSAEALKWYEAAAAAPGATPGAWRELAGYFLRRAEFGKCGSAADAGLKQYTNDADLLAMKERARELEPLAQEPAAGPLLSFLSFDPRHPAALHMLGVVRAAHSGKLAAAQAAAEFGAGADRYPHFLPLQAAAVGSYLKVGEAAKAEQVARRAGANFPDEPDALRLLANLYAATGRWPEARGAAAAWKRLDPRSPVEPDLLIARARLNTKDAAGAAATLADYVKAEAAKAQAGRNDARVEVLDVYARALISQGKTADAATLLEPLAKSSAPWRRLWLDLAGAFRARDEAAAWVTRIEPAVPADAPRERVQLAGAWHVVGRQFADEGSLRNARKIAEPLAADAGVGAEAWTLLASCDEGLGNLDAAEREYREALKLRPDHTDLMNNLAYVLLRKGDPKALAEARALAAKAVTAAPAVASYYDTLARIEAKSGNADAAVSAFQNALARDRGSLEAMIGLADVLSRSNRRDDARRQLAQIDAALQSSPRLSPALATQLETVRTSLRTDVQSGRAE